MVKISKNFTVYHDQIKSTIIWFYNYSKLCKEVILNNYIILFISISLVARSKFRNYFYQMTPATDPRTRMTMRMIPMTIPIPIPEVGSSPVSSSVDCLASPSTFDSSKGDWGRYSNTKLYLKSSLFCHFSFQNLSVPS